MEELFGAILNGSNGSWAAFIAAVAGATSARLVNILKPYIKNILPGEGNQFDEARKGVVDGFAFVAAGAVSWGLAWLAGHLGGIELDVPLTGMIAWLISQGLYFARKNQTVVELSAQVEEVAE